MQRAPYASSPGESRGRLYAEPESATRTAFQRDRDRIIHSTAFRRLMHKTQVFVHHEGDHYRTRLTHSLEVAQIARSICRVLALDEDLGEALALAHDFGHPPFGHAGEDALNEAMAGFGGFDHNAQTLRILTRIEARYPSFDGLNLTWETLEGVVKHNGPIAADQVLPVIADYVAVHDLELDSHAGLEAQVAALADDIAYNNHDVDDGLRAGLFTVAQLSTVPFAGDAFRAAAAVVPSHEDQSRLIHEAVRQMIGAMVDDVIGETRRRLAAARPADVDALRRLDTPMAAFSAPMAEAEAALKAFLGEHMYRHPRVTAKRDTARAVLRDLFAYYSGDAARLPEGWRGDVRPDDKARAARRVVDYIAGMTDRFAVSDYNRIYKDALVI